MKTKKLNGNMYTFLIGLQDKDTYKQVLSTQHVANLIQEVCKGYNVGFSLSSQLGGYVADNGQYIVERSIRLSITEISSKQAKQIANHLLNELNQESILMTKEKAKIIMLK